MPSPDATTSGPGVAGGLAATARALADGATTSVEVVEATLARIAAAQPHLNAFRRVRASAARAEAAAADRRLADGDHLPLLGVPVAVKDDTETVGDETRFGTHEDMATIDGDAEVVTRLRAAGAVVVGKTTTCEFGQWPFTSGPAFGYTRNPWDPTRTPGGSSGGSGAAVAAGLVPAALGSDGAGSIRIPAAWTHLVGIKPGVGVVPIRGGALGFNELTVNGPLARTVGDAALLLDVVAGTGQRYQRAARGELGPLRVGVSFDHPFLGRPVRPDPEITDLVRDVAATLAQAGHHVTDVSVDHGVSGPGFLPRSLVGVHAWTQRVADRSRLDGRTRENARIGSVLRGPALAAAMRARARARRTVGRAFQQVDVLLAPTTATPPPEIGAFDDLSGWRTDLTMATACPYTFAWNVLGWPGVDVPAGRTAAGLPIGVQLLGPAGAEGGLVALAAQLEQLRRWDAHRPPPPPPGER